MAEEGDFVRAAPEAGDVVADPFDGEALVEQAYVLADSWVAGESEDVDSVVDRYDHDVLGISEILAYVEGSVRVSQVETYSREESSVCKRGTLNLRRKKFTNTRPP